MYDKDLNIEKEVRRIRKDKGLFVSPMPSLLFPKELDHWAQFLTEEIDELYDAHNKNDLVAAADAIADLIIVATGLGVAMGLPVNAIVDKVLISNKDKEKVANASESKRGWADDLKKTEYFISPEPEIRKLLIGCYPVKLVK